MSVPVGFVSIVGAGPGDPELVTVRGLKRLREADAVVHDRLVPSELLAECDPGARIYNVGKIPGTTHCSFQDEINDLLIALAKEGLKVVRLKGGDPFIFGRGGEEMITLAEHNIPFEIVPGITSAIAGPAAAGIPVTHRGVSTSVTVLTGHAREGTPDHSHHDWKALARMKGTLVFLMAVENLESIVSSLLHQGRSPDEPAALIRMATTPSQESVFGTLSNIAVLALERDLRPPAVLVIGDTINVALQCMESRTEPQNTATPSS